MVRVKYFFSSYFFMRKTKHFSIKACRCVVCAASICIIFTASSSPGDVIYTSDGKQFDGVVLGTNEEKVTVATAEGEKTFKRVEIGSIAYDSELENLLKTAVYAEGMGDAAKACYIYEKAFRLDPSSNRAADGMERMQKALYGDKGDAIVANYGRYKTPANSPEDSEKVLAQNSAETEKTLKDFGLIVIDRDVKPSTANSGYYDKFKIADVVAGSRAYDAGLRVADSLVELDGSRTEYMGVYDIAAHFSKKGNAVTTVKIEREIRIWVSQPGEDGSMGEAAGFEVSAADGGVVVTGVKRDSSADTAGLKAGDLIVMVNSIPVKGVGVGEAVRLMKQSIPGYADIFVQRKVEIR